MGATAAPTPKDCRPDANSAGRPSSAGSHQPSSSETHLRLGRSTCTIESPSPVGTHIAHSTAPHAKGRLPDARRRAARDHGF
jgi:hypothetical protein